MSLPYLTDPSRLAAIEATQLLDTPADERFDRYTRLTQRVLGVETVIVSLVLGDRQFYKSFVGLRESLASARGSPISVSLCRIGVERRQPLIICDGRRDSEFSDHVAVAEHGVVSYLGIPIFDEDGHALGTLCVANSVPREWSDEDVENLTVLAQSVRGEILLHKHEIRQKVAKSEHEFLDGILETSIAGIVVLDTAGQIVFCNQGAERVLGWESSDIEGRTYDDPIWRCTDLEGAPWPDDQQPFNRVLGTGQAVKDVQMGIERPDGMRRIISVSGAPIHDDDGMIVRLFFLVTDITEAFEAKQSVAKIAAQFRQTFRMAPNFIVLCEEHNGEIKEVSEGFLQSLKLSRDTCVGQRLDQLGVGFKTELIERVRLNAGGEMDADAVDLQLQATDDQIRNISARGQIVEVGTERYICIVGHDLTDQRAADQRRVALEAQLRDAQRAEVVGQLAGGMAHDFNNILTAIIGNTELALRVLETDHPAQRSLALIKKAGHRAVEQIRQILEIGHKEPGPTEPINVSSVVDECVTLFRTQVAATVNVQVERPTMTANVSARSAQIHQILINLLTNAAHAVGEHGNITVRIDPAVREKGGSLSSNDPVFIEVQDDGPGIDPVSRGLIFDAFYTTKRNGSGSGIGLTLARTLARSFDGDLMVESEPGQGALFRLQLPRVPHADATKANTVDPFGMREGRPSARILLVDDDDEVLQTGCMMIEQLGHEVTTTQDVEAALKSLTQPNANYDLLITDNLMPNLTGIELIQRLRDQGIMIPAVLISGYGTARTQIEKLGQHNAVFVAKPFSVTEISDAIQSVMGN